MLKKCTKCGKTGEFYTDSQKTDGLDSWCKLCRKVASTDSRERNIDKIRAYDRGRRYARLVKNREKEREYNYKWRKEHASHVKKLVKRSNYKKRSRLYGLTHEEFLGMLIMQGYKCAICEVSIPERRDQHIDHDHKNNKVRAILCAKCNRGIGHFNDDSKLLLVAAMYLRGYSEIF